VAIICVKSQRSAERPVAHDLRAIAPATDAHGNCAVNASGPLSTPDASPGTRTQLSNFATLNVLLSVAQDAAAMPAERRKAASGAAEYFLPKKRNKKKPVAANLVLMSTVFLSIRV
jgi:hypothetical protein